MKTSKADFERFKKEFMRWVYRLGLTQYEIRFEHCKLEDAYAQIAPQEMDKIAVVRFAKEINCHSKKYVERLAKHEVLHLVVYRLRWLGGARYIEEHDLQEEWEAVTVRLENAFKD